MNQKYSTSLNSFIKVKYFILLLWLITLSSLSSAQQQWTSEKILSYNTITESTISDDGKYVAYVVKRALTGGDTSEFNSQIWVAAANGSVNRQLTKGVKTSVAPQFSPNGKLVAFLSASESGNDEIFIIPLSGGEKVQVTNTKSGIASFKWSPDGKRFAYLAEDSDTNDVQLAKKQKRYVIVVDHDYNYSHLYTVALDIDENGKRKTKQLTSGAFSVNSFDWSPDNLSIAFSYSPTPKANDGILESDISKIASDSGRIIPIVRRPGLDNNPHYSPDGKWIAFESTGGKEDVVGLADLFKVPAEGGSIIPLQQTPDRLATIIAWAADGSYLFVSEDYKTSQVLIALPSNPQGKLATKDYAGYANSKLPIITNVNGYSTAFSISKTENKVAYVFENTTTPKELFLSDAKGNNQQKLSSINKGFTLPKMGRTELINWKSEDGVKIEGLLTYPVDYDKSKKYPIILEIHGGPASVFYQNFTGSPTIYVTQLFAERGFIILRPNPRGSSGYGKDFRFANVGDWGYGDYKDLVAGVDHVLAMGIADPDKQFVMGWSYGGYMTSWIVTQTNRFKAASMGAGSPDLVSMIGTTDVPDYFVTTSGGKELWQDFEQYQKHSALYKIGNAITPTQILQGINDRRVPISQGQEFYNALKRKHVDAEMVVYPRSGHVPQEPKLLMDISLRVIQWFNQYL